MSRSWENTRAWSLRGRAQSSLFRDNRNIRILNMLLGMELSAVEMYRSLQRRLPEKQWVEIHRDNHHLASRNLIQIIIRHRGLPQQSMTFTGEVFALLLEISFLFSGRIVAKFRRSMYLIFENYLNRCYEKVIVESSDSDAQGLRQQQHLIQGNIARLKGPLDSLM